MSTNPITRVAAPQPERGRVLRLAPERRRITRREPEHEGASGEQCEPEHAGASGEPCEPERPIGEALADERQAAVPVIELILAQPGWGPKRARCALHYLGIPENASSGDLEARQRRSLADLVTAHVQDALLQRPGNPPPF